MRDRISNILGVSSVVTLAVGAAMTGMRYPGVLSTWLLTTGGALLVACAVVNVRTLARFSRRRAARHGANAIVMSLLLTAVLILVQAIAIRHSRQADLTRNRRYTLAMQTKNILRDLDADISVTAFYQSTTVEHGYAEQLLDLYARLSDHFRYEIIDPDKRPHIAEQMGATNQNIVVTMGSRSRKVTTPNEETLTNAILQVTLDRFKTIYFVIGHNEKDIDSRDRGGYTSARKGLESEGYNVRELSLVDVERIPDDCEVLIIGGPRKRFLSSEIDKVAAYLDDGGSAMFLIDPRAEVPGIEGLLSGYNIALDPVVLLDELVVVDTGDRMFDATVTKVHRYEPHAITRGFNAITMYPMARPIRITSPDSPDLRIEAFYLAITEESAWGETDMNSFTLGSATRDDDDVAPPLPVSAAVVKHPPIGPPGDGMRDSRIVVVGDSDFINNVFYGLLGNSDFFLNSINYLAGDEKLISIRPKRGLGDRVFITEAQGRFIFAICLVLLPLSAVGTGVTVLVRNRKA